MGNLAILRDMSLVDSIRARYNKSIQPALGAGIHGSGSSDGGAGASASGGRQRVMLKEERIAQKQARLDAFTVSDAQSLIHQVPAPLSHSYVLTSALSERTNNNNCYHNRRICSKRRWVKVFSKTSLSTSRYSTPMTTTMHTRRKLVAVAVVVEKAALLPQQQEQQQERRKERSGR